jgi:hypothetical protein
VVLWFLLLHRFDENLSAADPHDDTSLGSPDDGASAHILQNDLEVFKLSSTFGCGENPAIVLIARVTATFVEVRAVLP